MSTPKQSNVYHVPRNLMVFELLADEAHHRYRPPIKVTGMKKTQQENSFQSCFKPLWIALRLLGVFPIDHSEAGVATYIVKSSAFIYATLVFGLVGSLNSRVTAHRIEHLRTGASFNSIIFSYMLIAYCSAYWLSPIGHWMGARKVARYLNHWTEFQTRSRKLTGVPLSLNIRRQVLFYTIAIPVMITLLVITEFVLLNLFEYWEAIYFVYIGSMVNYHYILWYYVCSALAQASSYLMENLTEQLRAHSHDQRLVPAHRELWDELSSLTRETGNVLCYTYGSIISMTISILTTSLYGCLSETDKKDGLSKQFGLFYNSLLVFFIMAVFCNSAHLATRAVSLVVNGFASKVGGVHATDVITHDGN